MVDKQSFDMLLGPLEAGTGRREREEGRGPGRRQTHEERSVFFLLRLLDVGLSG